MVRWALKFSIFDNSVWIQLKFLIRLLKKCQKSNFLLRHQLRNTPLVEIEENGFSKMFDF